MQESLPDRVARALGEVCVGRQDDGTAVYLHPAHCLDLAHAALSVIQPATDAPQPEPGAPTRVLPAKFILDAMFHAPDALPPDFT